MSAQNGFFDPSVSEIAELVNRFLGFPLCTVRDEDVGELKTKLLSQGKGFQSNVYQVSFKFRDKDVVEFAVKVPRLNAFDVVHESAKKDGYVSEVEDRTVLDGFNNECTFYQSICPIKLIVPVPKPYYIEKLDANRLGSGLICMESLCSKAEIVGIGQSLTAGQAFNVARCVAQLQFYTRKGQLAEMQAKHQRLPVHLQEFYLAHLPGAIPEIRKIPEIQELLPTIQPIFSRNFAFYALMDKPKEYDCVGFCHGDLYSNNVMFKLAEDGTTSDEVGAIFDWQLNFRGSLLFDLARLVVLSLDEPLRLQIEESIFEFYFDQVEEIYQRNNEEPKFSREQAKELYVLALCQQTVFLVAFVGLLLVTDRKPNGDPPDCFEAVKTRAIASMKLCVERINQYNLDKFLSYRSK